MEDYEKVFTDKIEKGLLAHGFEPVKRQQCVYKREKTNRTDRIYSYIRIGTLAKLSNNKCIQTIAVEFTTELGVPSITRTDGYIIIHYTMKDDCFLSASALCVPYDISVINTTIKDIRKRLIATGYFGRSDI